MANIILQSGNSRKKGIVIQRKGLIKSAKPVLAEDEKLSRLSITVVPLIKSDKEYETGRKGELIIASQSKKYKIIIVQQK